MSCMHDRPWSVEIFSVPDPSSEEGFAFTLQVSTEKGAEPPCMVCISRLVATAAVTLGCIPEDTKLEKAPDSAHSDLH